MDSKPEVTCELKYIWPNTRFHVNYFEFNFYGKCRFEYRRKWYEYKDKDYLYNENKKKRENIKKDLDDVKKKIEDLTNAKNPYSWWKQTYKWRIWRINRKVELNELYAKKKKLEQEADRFCEKEIWDELYCIWSFLEKHDFYKVSESRGEYNRTDEIWAI